MKQWIARWCKRIRRMAEPVGCMPLEADEPLCFVVDWMTRR
jgi:hypothetical protein